MLKKRTRSMQKDQNQMSDLTMPDSGSESHFPSDFSGAKHKNTSFFSVSGLFVGLNHKGLSDTDSVRSPTSPLDFRVFSNLGNSLKSSKPSNDDGHNRKSWDCNKVGLGIIDSLDDDTKVSGKIYQSFESKNILFGPQIRSTTTKIPNRQIEVNSFQEPKSLPKNYAIFSQTRIKSPLHKDNSDVLFEIGTSMLEPEPFGKIRACSLDSFRSFSALSSRADCGLKINSGNKSLENATTQIGSPCGVVEASLNAEKFIGPLPGSEIELSEDYTCVISHGPNPKITYIYGDCILECHSNELSNFDKNEEKEIGSAQPVKNLDISTLYRTSDFLSICFYCKRKLEEGKDIYMYRGEKAFCSLDCRSQEILIDEELEKSVDDTSDNFKAENGEDLFETGTILDA